MGQRATKSNPPNRFERLAIVPDPDQSGVTRVSGVPGPDGTPDPTLYFRDASRSLITRNDSPDVPFTYSLNPYRGCEHGCIYCYARPTHEFLGLSAGLDFESRIFVKERAPELLRDELRRRSWKGDPLAMSGVTDPYQPVERQLRLVRRCLELMADYGQPVTIVTKSALVTRDTEVLAELSRQQAAHVCLTITTLDEGLRRALEPRAATADARLGAIAKLKEAGVPVGVMVAPVIPGLTDHEVPAILEAAASAGARFGGYTMLRLPHGVADLFERWLEDHVPAARAKVMGRIRQVRRGAVSDARCGTRMRGEGPLADVTQRLFAIARDRAGLAPDFPPLSSASFRRPWPAGSLFDDRGGNEVRGQS
jgi:DNA repair photolyase